MFLGFVLVFGCLGFQGSGFTTGHGVVGFGVQKLHGTGLQVWAGGFLALSRLAA